MIKDTLYYAPSFFNPYASCATACFTKKTSTKYLLYYIICSFTLGEFLIHHVLPFFTVHMTIACHSFYNLYP